MTMMTRWGELEETESDTDAEDQNDHHKINWNSFEVPPLYQPATSHKGSRKEVSKRSLLWMKPPLDTKEQSFLLQSIDLQHYKRRMRYMLSAAQSHQNEMQKGNGSDSPVLPSPPPPPKRFCASDGRLVTHTQSGFLSTEYSAEANGKGLENKHFHCPIQLDALATRQLMFKSVAAVTAHAGYETATEVALNTLTDVVTENCFKLCKMMKERLNQKLDDESVVDTFNRIYRMAASEDILSLQEYWITRVKNAAMKFEKEGLELLDEYNALKESSNRAVVKEEKG